MKHLHEIRGRFAVRIVVPPELRGIVGKNELRKWLGSDRRAAERNAHAVVGEFHRRIDEARAVLVATAPTVRSAANAHYVSELLADDRERASGGNLATANFRSWTAPARATLLRLLLADQLGSEEAEVAIGDAADALIDAGLAPATIDRKALLKGVAEAHLAAMKAFEERDQGKVGASEPTFLQDQEAVAVAAPSPRTHRHPGGTTKPLSALLADFHAERTAGNGSVSENTIKEHEVAVRMLEEFLGPGIPAASITHDDMLAYKRALMQTPANYRQRFPGKSLVEAISANLKLTKPFATLNPQTINNKWLSHISAIMTWCFNNGLLPVNAARGVKVDEGRGFKEPTRTAFSQDDLARIFGTPMFADPSGYGSRQWSLLIALYTGARSSSEIRRIKLNDVYREQGVLVFDLIEATKNTHSKRLVPVHEALLNLGIEAYVQRLRASGKTRLFWDWEPGDKINRWFLRSYKAKVGITDARKVFHSFRHSLKTELARRGVNRDVSDLITGHKDQSVGGIYIGDASMTMIKAMSEGINRADFGLGVGKQGPGAGRVPPPAAAITGS